MHKTIDPVDDLSAELQRLTEEAEHHNYLHYVKRDRPFSPALCGEPTPRKGWWSNPETEVKAAVDSWEICPACKVKHSMLPTGGPADE